MLCRKWEIEGEKIKKIRSRSRIRRFIGSKTDAKAVAGHLGAIDQSIHDFMVRDTPMLLVSFTIATARKHFPDRS
jgi:hypothetical protein